MNADIEKVRKQIEEQKLMETWELRPGTDHWHRGYLFKFAVAVGDIAPGSFLQRNEILYENKRLAYSQYVPKEVIDDYPEAFVLHRVPDGAWFWAQQLMPYQGVGSTQFLEQIINKRN